MADRTFSVHKQSQAKSTTLLKKHGTFEVEVIDDADTVTVTTMTTIDNAKVINLADGSDVTINVATNVITINDVAATGIRVLVVAVGV